MTENRNTRHRGEVVKDAVAGARLKAKRKAEKQTQELADQVHGINEALRETAHRLENPTLGQSLEILATQVERTAELLENAEVSKVVETAEEFSRNQPLLFLSGSFLAGLVTARFFRASSHRNGEQEEVQKLIPPVAAGSRVLPPMEEVS
jgi:hypothetical protein